MSSPTKGKEFENLLNESMQSNKLYDSRTEVESPFTTVQPTSAGRPAPRNQFIQNNQLNQGRGSNDLKANETPQYPTERYTSAARIGNSGSSENPYRGVRNPIFERKTYRGTQGVSHSPIKERDEDLLRQVLYSKAKPSQPKLKNNDLIDLKSMSPGAQKRDFTDEETFNFESKARAAPEKSKKNFLAAAKDDMLGVLGESRAMDKKIATNLEGKYDSPEVNKSQPGAQLKTGANVRSTNPSEVQFKHAAEARRTSPSLRQNNANGYTNPFADSKGRIPSEGQFNTVTWGNDQSLQYDEETPQSLHKGGRGIEGKPNKPDDWSNNQNYNNGIANRNARDNRDSLNGSQSQELPRSNKLEDQKVASLTDAGTFNSPELMQLILREDKILKGEHNSNVAESPADFIPSEFMGSTNDVKEKMSVRASEGKLTMQARLSQSPNRQEVRGSNWMEQAPPQREQRKSNVQETNKSSRQVPIAVNSSEQKLRSQNDMSDMSFASQQRGRDMNRSVADDNSELIDAWPSMKYRELAKPGDDSGDDDDDGGNFCGICVSSRKKKTKKSKKN